ncbi:hypothetical protein B566_EDAN009938 [Ephemera danica]|nr:hypothetical protein B566_EDAN009938 [Ephemera danica]
MKALGTFLVICHVYAVLSFYCPVSEDAKPETKLRSKLFCSYDRQDRQVRPRKEFTNFVNVNLTLHPKYIDIIEHSKALVMQSIFTISWIDENLTWEINDFDGIARIIVSTTDIWIPSLCFELEYKSPLFLENTECALNYTGYITCRSEVQTSVMCSLNLQNWPNDIRHCNILVSSLQYGLDRLKISFINKSGIQMDAYISNRAWKLLSITALKWMDSENSEAILDISITVRRRADSYYTSIVFPAMEMKTSSRAWKILNFKENTFVRDINNRSIYHISYILTVKRTAAGHRSAIVFPSLVISALLLTTFWLHPGVARVGVCCVVIILDILFLQYIGFVAPASGDSTPTIASGALLFTIIMGHIVVMKRDPPLCLRTVAQFLLRCPGASKFLVTGGADPETLNWRVLATLVDRVAFVTTLTLQLSMQTLIPSAD